MTKFPFCDGSHNDHNHNTRDNIGPLIIVDSRKRGKSVVPSREQIRNECKKNNNSQSHNNEEKNNSSSGRGGKVPKKKEEIAYDTTELPDDRLNEKKKAYNDEEEDEDVPSTVPTDPKTKKDQ